ncbi:hypothetical protein ACFWNI_04270 [Streptomyces sp. NPDC058377]|uniref:hypothetical protein n=1 Tax=Streptomyces sp. NPDC058377 TaxID=3346468 RepID=UPI00364DFBFB
MIIDIAAMDTSGRLLTALRAGARHAQRSGLSRGAGAHAPELRPDQVCPPRDASFARTLDVPAIEGRDVHAALDAVAAGGAGGVR